MTNTQPLDRAFNVAVNHIASRLFPTGYDVADEAPDTFEKLKAHVATTGRMLVWKGASDQTIFADPETNWAFRAWHDFCHVTGNHDFTLEGERAAALMQAEHVRQVYGQGRTYRRFRAIILAEVIGQAEHLEQTGAFPSNQYDFTAAYVAKHAA